MKRIYLFALLFLFSTAIWAENVVTTRNEVSLQATTSMELMFSYLSRIQFPYLYGSHPLTAGNNLAFSVGAEVTPISAMAKAELILTPVAFLELNAGGNIGTGWNITIFEDDIYGIGFNVPLTGGGAEHRGSAFEGFHWKGFGGAALQADLAAFFPGAWNHVVFRSYHEISYRAYSKATLFQESWYYLNDKGENRNSFYYYGNAILGYQMPIFLSMVALVAEAERDLYLDGAPNPSQWGHDILYWTFSSILNFRVTSQFDIGLALQFHTQKNYQQANWEELFYTGRTVDRSNPMHLEFRRVAVVFTYKF